MNVITDGFEVSSITYSTSRKHSCTAINLETSHSPTLPNRASNLVLSFIDNEDSTLINPHHDNLIISLLISNYRIKRILLDNGFSTNVIFLITLKEMNIDESHIHHCSAILLGSAVNRNSHLGTSPSSSTRLESTSTSPLLCSIALQLTTSS